MAAWWLEGGSERCEHCLQLYVYEMEYRCVACDGALCPVCALVVRETTAVLCPGCEDTGGTERGRERAEATSSGREG